MTDTIILGLDGATWDVLNPLIRENRLPNLARLKESGQSGVLESTFPPITAPAWLSMATGQNPGKTGVFYFLNREDPNSFEFDTLGSDKFQGQCFWDVLSQQGHDVGIFNYPMLYPPYKLDGYMVSGLGSPEDNTITYPSELRRELDDVTGGYQIKVPYADPKYAGNPKALEADLHDIVQKREQAIEYLLTERETDIFFGVLSATDWVQHYFWRYHDPEHALHESGTPYSDTIARLWERVDETVGTVADIAAERDATLLLVSDHGFGPVNQTFHSNEWLHQKGFSVADQGSPLERLQGIVFPYLRQIAEPVVAAVPQLNDFAKTVGQSIRGNPGAIIDMERSIAFAPRQNLTCGMIYTLTDNPAAETRIIETLRSLTDADGTTLNVSVYRPEDLYTGPKMELAPDILFKIDDFEYAIDPRASVGDDLMTSGPPSASRSGGHRTEGIYIASGPDISAADGDTASLLDVAPTVLFAQDEPIPDIMDGCVLLELFTDQFLNKRTERRTPLEKLIKPSDGVERTDSDAVQDRLEDLGYL